MITEEIKEIIIDKLSQLYVKQFFEDKNNNKTTYVKLTQCYLDLMKFFENFL